MLYQPAARDRAPPPPFASVRRTPTINGLRKACRLWSVCVWPSPPGNFFDSYNARRFERIGDPQISPTRLIMETCNPESSERNVHCGARIHESELVASFIDPMLLLRNEKLRS